jgi:hypothetical protein
LMQTFTHQCVVVNHKNFHVSLFVDAELANVLHVIARQVSLHVQQKGPQRLACGPCLAGDSANQPPWIFIMSGTISKATMLMILISGLTAGPAVSL